MLSTWRIQASDGVTKRSLSIMGTQKRLDEDYRSITRLSLLTRRSLATCRHAFVATPSFLLGRLVRLHFDTETLAGLLTHIRESSAVVGLEHSF
jgi:hypothetical protein